MNTTSKGWVTLIKRSYFASVCTDRILLLTLQIYVQERFFSDQSIILIHHNKSCELRLEIFVSPPSPKKKIRNFIFEKQYSIWNQDKGTIMAGLLSKNKELLRLIPDLQCHDCKSVPGPNENQKNRYSCFDASHILCEEHKAKCPCGSKVKNFIKPARLFWTGPNHFVQVHIKFSRLIFVTWTGFLSVLVF